MNDDQQTLIRIPTELERRDAIFDFMVLAMSVLGVWWAANTFGLRVAVCTIPLMAPLWIWALSGEPLSDMQYVGALATGVRNLFGWRRAHEWLQAGSRYWKLAVYPVWRAQCLAFYRSSRERISRWRAGLTAAIKQTLLRASSWASVTRYRLLGRPAK